MVKSLEQAKRIQAKRKAVGKNGIAIAVRRWLNREKLPASVLSI